VQDIGELGVLTGGGERWDHKGQRNKKESRAAKFEMGENSPSPWQDTTTGWIRRLNYKGVATILPQGRDDGRLGVPIKKKNSFRQCRKSEGRGANRGADEIRTSD